MYYIHRKEENILKYIYIDKMNFNVLHNIEIKGKNSNPNALGFHASLNSAAKERAYSFKMRLQYQKQQNALLF